MLKSYEEQGKEFGLTHKGDYWKILLLFSFLTHILSYFITTVIVLALFLLVAVYGKYDLANVFLYILILFEFILYFVITVPLSGFGLELIADTNTRFSVRFSRCFDIMNLNSILGSFTTNMLFALPIILYLFIADKIHKYYFGLNPFTFDTYHTLSLQELIILFVVFLPAIYTFCKLSVDYFLVPYLLALDVGLTGRKARKESKRLMKGHINETFGFYLRLLLLGILSTLLVIPLIWYLPYAYATLTYFAIDRLSDGDYISYEEDEEDEEPVNELDSLLQ